jgi:peptide-methionine (R)-S-oxide reductase
VADNTKTPKIPKIEIDEEELKKRLTPQQYQVLREKGTEAPFSSPLLNDKSKGMFACAACGNELFSSDAKFNSAIAGLGGWPSFDQAIPGSVEFSEDNSYGMRRTEVTCARCGSHLGHVFDDNSETDTGKHYCINGACLLMKKSKN